jgi:uncharacterized membrane protein
MSFLLLITAASLAAWIPQALLGRGRDLQMAMRHGLALGLVFTGIDHFASAETRYVPMMPAFLAPQAMFLVQASGVAELLGAMALLMPSTLYRRLRLPDLRPAAGVALAVMFAVLVVANINVAVQGAQVDGLAFGRTYYLIRPFLQPIFILWALYSTGWLRRRATARQEGTPQPLEPT